MFEFGVKPEYLWLCCCGITLDVFNAGKVAIRLLAVVYGGFGYGCSNGRGRFKENGGIVNDVKEE